MSNESKEILITEINAQLHSILDELEALNDLVKIVFAEA
jgi:hypothetical protein